MRLNKKRALITISATVVGIGIVGLAYYKYMNNKETVKPQLKLVALGDSLTEGMGDSTKQGGYTQRLAKLINNKLVVPTKVLNYGNSGDRSDQINQHLTNSTQQQIAIKKADAIIMTVGGDDLIQKIGGSVLDRSAKELTQAIKASEPEYTAKLTKLMQSIRRYNKTAPIFVFGNYNPLYVYFANLQSINTSVIAYNNINKKIVKKYHGYYVSTFKQLTFGQYQSALAKQKLLQEANASSVEGVVKTLHENKITDEKNAYIAKSDHFHPNSKGYNYMTKKLYATMIKHKATWLYEK
ncbi:lysophospholipase L1-like esterase [Weissella beninensis]|uniref:Hydrolase n=1 Tax=Periweissella beninensis TaxID=504936 RepID=A0ABT0VG09_9LACO|nr:GDSL-type esterase/lipase family protein [Periweissella beninensis]MBM7543851.1 lysophospholipase L1-like esterase [Periweissella beninensis]MCM2436768.1 hydrolase [Periweissella beninensis]